MTTDSPAERMRKFRGVATTPCPSPEDLARISHHLTVEARNSPAITVLRLLAVLNVGFKYARISQKMSRRAARALY